MSFEITKLDPDQIEDLPVQVNQVVFAKRTDIVNDNLIYKGEAYVGSSSANPVWRIRRLTISNDGDVIEEWADGNDNFDNIWNDRTGLTYI